MTTRSAFTELNFLLGSNTPDEILSTFALDLPAVRQPTAKTCNWHTNGQHLLHHSNRGLELEVILACINVGLADALPNCIGEFNSYASYYTHISDLNPAPMRSHLQPAQVLNA